MAVPRSILIILIYIHIIFTLFYTGHFVLFNSSLPLLFSSDYFWEKKIEIMRGGDYLMAQAFADLPLDVNYLIISPANQWLLNYYLFPRKLFAYKGISMEADLEKVPRDWLRDKKIEYVILYIPPDVRVVKLDRQKSAGEK
jgi:hypothetical protein